MSLLDDLDDKFDHLRDDLSKAVKKAVKRELLEALRAWCDAELSQLNAEDENG